MQLYGNYQFLNTIHKPLLPQQKIFTFSNNYLYLLINLNLFYHMLQIHGEISLYSYHNCRVLLELAIYFYLSISILLNLYDIYLTFLMNIFKISMI